MQPFDKTGNGKRSDQRNPGNAITAWNARLQSARTLRRQGIPVDNKVIVEICRPVSLAVERRTRTLT